MWNEWSLKELGWATRVCLLKINSTAVWRRNEVVTESILLRNVWRYTYQLAFSVYVLWVVSLKSVIFHVCFWLVKFTGKPALHVTLMTVCPPCKGRAFLPPDLGGFFKKLFHGFVMLLLFTFSPKKWIVGARNVLWSHIWYSLYTLYFL